MAHATAPSPALAAPRVSVVTTAYGDLRFLAAAVDSILNQDFTDFEFIVVDDASAEPHLFRRLAAHDARIRIIRNEANLGPAEAANRGIAAARGDIIARIDADDLAAPTRLSRQVAAFDDDPQLALLGSWYIRIDEEDREVESFRPPTSDAELRWSLLFHNPLCHSSFAFRRTAFDATGGYNNDEAVRASVDTDLCYRMAAVGGLGCLPEFLASWRINPRGITANNSSDWRRRTQQHRERLWAAHGVPYAAGLIDELARFVSGWDVGRTEMRPRVYACAIRLRRSHAGLHPNRQTDDETRRLLTRILDDRHLGTVAWTRFCWSTWQLDPGMALVAARRKVTRTLRRSGGRLLAMARKRTAGFGRKARS